MTFDGKAYVVLEEALDALIENARDAAADYRDSGTVLDRGRLLAYYDALTVLLQEAELVDLTLPARLRDFEPDRELLFAGRQGPTKNSPKTG
ncbi:MAG: hypothetical protein H6958_05275 [Chromatiaceae bacterium]|nr:hypothetical protein [Chromatiaceae bacterium]